jgi:hypothetical protein
MNNNKYRHKKQQQQQQQQQQTNKQTKPHIQCTNIFSLYIYIIYIL